MVAYEIAPLTTAKPVTAACGDGGSSQCAAKAVALAGASKPYPYSESLPIPLPRLPNLVKARAHGHQECTQRGFAPGYRLRGMKQMLGRQKPHFGGRHLTIAAVASTIVVEIAVRESPALIQKGLAKALRIGTDDQRSESDNDRARPQARSSSQSRRF